MSATKLMSGYIELTVKKSADAFKEITAEITNVGKQADKVGKQAGESIGGGIAKGATDGAKRAGKSVGDELSKSAKRAGEDAGKQVGDALEKGATRGAKRTGRAVRDEITKGAKRAGDDVAKTKVEPKVVPKVDTKPARETIIKDVAGGILEAARQGAKDAGVDLDKWAVEQAGKLGGKLGQEIHDAVPESVRNVLSDVRDQIQLAADGTRKFADGLRSLRSGDAVGAVSTINGLAGGFRAIGQANAAGAIQGFGAQLMPLAGSISEINGLLDGLIGKSLNARTAIGGLGGALSLQQINAGAQNGNAGQAAVSGLGLVASGALAGSTFGPAGALAGGALGLGVGAAGVIAAEENKADAQWYQDRGLTPVISTSPGAPVAPMTEDDKKKVSALILPGHASGGIAGVTGAGRVFGPGTGTSDSIVGVGADGTPTARVSVGEGVIRKAAMDAGWDRMVAAANAGMLPGFDSGTGIGGVPAPDPMMQRFYDALQSGRILPNGQLPMGVGSEGGLQINTIRGKRTISALFPEITNIGGYRQDSLKWHPNGLALDLMIPGQGGLNDPTTPAGKALGDQINAFLQQNSAALGSDYSMWQVPDHHNHVHANFAPSGMPGKDQQYFLPPQLQAMLAGASGAGLPVGGGQMPNMAMMLGANGQAAQIAAMLGMGGQTGAGQQLGTGLPSGVGRTQGFIPAAAGASGKAGTSFMSGVYQMGASAINGLIDQAASAAATAVSAGAMVGSFGAGGQAAGSAASFAIGLGTQAAKRGIQYGAQMAGIGTDALAEIFMPFGAPRLFNTDPTQFAPQLPGMPAAVTTGEKAQQQQNDGPVQPNQLPGQQPISAPLQFAKPEGIMPTAPPLTNVAGIKPPPGPVVPIPGMGEATQGAAAAAPPVRNLRDYFSRVGVFDDGGWLPPGGTAINMSHRPEPILNSEQWADVREIAGRPTPTPDPKAVSGYSPDYSVNISGVQVTDVNALQKEIDSRQRLQMMRHAGRP